METSKNPITLLQYIKQLSLFMLLLIFPHSLSAGLPKCMGVSDGAAEMWFMVPDPGGDPLPGSKTIALDQNYLAEGAAYRASNQKMYLFDCDGDNDGPCDIHEITTDIANGTSTKTVVKTDMTDVAHGGGKTTLLRLPLSI